MSEPPPDITALVAEYDVDNSYQPPVLKRASVTAAVDSADVAPIAQPDKAPAPRLQVPAPKEALPATNARSLSGAAQPAGALQAAVSNEPFSLVIGVEPGSPLAPFAENLAADLRRRGIDAQALPLSEAGRPDAILGLDAGDRANEAPSAWYCDVAGASSRDLASAALNALPALPSLTASDTEAPPDAPGFDCESIHGGRARTAAVLLELPASIAAPATSSESVNGLAAGIDRYFSRYGASIKRSRAAAHLVWPAIGPITSRYGPAHPLGIDIGQWQGNIVAATAGSVFWAGGNPCCSYGKFVVIDSPDGIRTLYAHLGSIGVKQGDKVRQGQVLGRVGCTGACTGTHLHFEVIDRGVRQDPMGYLP